MFGRLAEDINKHVEKKKQNENEKNISLGSMAIFNPMHIRDAFNSIRDLDDGELYEILKPSYSQILEKIFREEDPFYLNLFTNSKFLTVFIQVISSVVLDKTETIYCNKIAYDYLTDSNNNSDEYQKSLFLNLSRTVNKNIIPSLLGIGLDENLSSYLALSRYSSSKEFVNIRRVNYLIIASSPNIMTEQMIVYIYEKLFDNFNHLFKYTMFDPYTDKDLESIGSGAAEIYSNMSLAIIDILNLMTSDDIRRVLYSYASDYNVTNEYNIRFSIYTLAVSDYGRILQVAENLEREELVFVP